MIKKQGQVLAVLLVFLAIFISILAVLLKATYNEATLVRKKHDMAAQQYQTESLARELWEKEQIRFLQAFVDPKAFTTTKYTETWDEVTEELYLSRPYDHIWLQRRSDMSLKHREAFAKDPQGLYGLARIATKKNHRMIFCDVRYRPCPASLTLGSPIYTDSLPKGDQEYLERVQNRLAHRQNPWENSGRALIYEPVTDDLQLILLPRDKGILQDGDRQTLLSYTDGLMIVAPGRSVNLLVSSDAMRWAELMFISKGNLTLKGYCHVRGFFWLLGDGRVHVLPESQGKVTGVLWQPRKAISTGQLVYDYDVSGISRFFRLMPEAMEPILDGIYYANGEPY